MPAPSLRTATLLPLFLLSACAGPDPLAGRWESVAIEGATLEEQGVVEMRMEFSADTVRWTTQMQHDDGAETDRRAFPYELRGDTLRLLPTSTESGGALRFRLSGDSLVLEGLEPEDARDVRIRMVRAADGS